MSVNKNERKESTAQFLDDMNELYRYTVAICMKCPKRWERFLTGKISDEITSALVSVKLGNNIFPQNLHEYQTRKDHFTEAIGRLKSLSTMIDVLFEYSKGDNESPPVTFKTIETWANMVNHEIKLLTGLKESDKKRFGKFLNDKNNPDKDDPGN